MSEVLKQVSERQAENQAGMDYLLQESITPPTNGQLPKSNQENELDHLNGVAHPGQETSHTILDYGQKEIPKTIAGRLLDILVESKQPMTIEEIWKAFLEKEGFQEIGRARVRDSATRLYRIGKIRRLEGGVYACLEYKVEQYQTRNIYKKIVEILDETKRPMHIQDIMDYLDINGIKGFTSKKIRGYLSYLYGQGKIKRPSRGFYVYLEFDGQENEITKSMSDRVIESLNFTKLPMTNKDVTNYCNKDGFETVNQQDISTKLSYLYRREKIKRLAMGVYVCLEFDGELNEIPKTISKRAIEILQNSGQPMPAREIVDNFNQGNHEKITLKRATGVLKYLCQQEKIKRLARSVYSCLEFEGHYKPPTVVTQPGEKRHKTTNTGTSKPPVRPTQPKKKTPEVTNIGNSKPKPKAPAQRREIETLDKPRNNLNLKPDKDPDDVLLQPTKRQKTMPIGSRIGKIINHWIGPITADGIIEALNKDGFREINPETVRPFVETKLQRRKAS